MIQAIVQAALVGSLAILPGIAWRVSLPDWLPGRAALSPLLGMCSVAWLIQLVYMFGGQAWMALAAAATMMCASILVYRNELMAALGEFRAQLLLSYLVFYVFCLLSTSLIVWPAAGPWSSDWLANFLQLEVIWKAEPLSQWLLARPPMFACFAVPYLPFMESLYAFQLGLCAVTAAGLLLVKSFVQSFTATRLALLPFLILFCASPFFLVNFTAFVPKFLQATLVVGSVLLMRGARGQDHLPYRMALSSLLLGLSMECHHSSIAYVFALALGWVWVGWQQPRQLVKGAVLAGLVGAFIVGVPELRKISLYGLEEIAKYNPSKAMRSPEPGWFVVLMTLECKFLGYQFLLPPYIWLKDLSLGALKPTEHYVFWSWIIWMGLASNTFVWIMLPFVFTWQRLQTFIAYMRSRVPFVLIVGAAIAILINCALNPYYISSGNVHCGSSALALALMILAIAWVVQQPDLLKPAQALTLALGSLPWALWQCIQFSKVLALGGYKVSGEVLDDNLDLPALLSISQEPWGYSQWPYLPVLLFLALILLVWFERNSTRQDVADHTLAAAA